MGGSCRLEASHPCTLDGVKKFKTGGDWEGEAPAEPHGEGVAAVMAPPGDSPSQFFHITPPVS
ncbi:MAG: hypothetical protein DMG06_23835 [Acidobacteria bacterium]|nr:MAG: hypothetical protein DMG06_23835 [Acidobacteriota bacterium]